MNPIRFYTLLCVQLCYSITYTSPNKDQEMGSQSGDQVINGGRTPTRVSNIIFQLYLTYLTLCNLSTFGDQSLSYMEWLFVCITVGGTIFRVWCYRELGNMFTFGLGIRKNHTLVTTGPYRYLAHPSYTGQMACAIGILMFLNVSVLNALIYILFITLMAIRRMHVEEVMMTRYFGDEYKIYLEKRWRVLPFII